jgi:4-amino-4-deoxy-L-arabinose transferase-like glycosyltransferase
MATTTIEPHEIIGQTTAHDDSGKRPALTSHRFRAPWMLPLAAVLLTIATRTIYLVSNRALFSADEATTGIMVRQILGGHFYTYFAGQHYGGTIEQYLEAFWYIVLRLPVNPLTLRLPLVLISALTCYVTYLTAKRIVGNPRAIIAALLFAVVPWFNIVGTTTSLGFYVAAQFLAIFSIYLALRITDGDSTQLRWGIAFGLCCGLALWTSITTIYLVLPAIVWVAPVAMRKFRLSVSAFAALLLGSAPLWVSTLINHTYPVPQSPINPIGVLQRLGNLFGPIAREYLGLTYAHARGGLAYWLQVLVEVCLIGLFLRASWRHRSGILRVLTLKTEGRDPINLLFLVPVVVVVSYVSSASTWYVGQPRYIMTTYPTFFIAIAYLCPTQLSKVARFVACTVVAGCVALSLGYFVTTTASPTLQQRDATLSRVISVLVADHEHDVYAGYWTAMPLEYLATNRVQVAVCIGAIRFPAIQHSVATHGPPVYIGSSLDGSNGVITRALKSHHLRFRARRIGFVTIYDHLSQGATPRRIGL